MNRKAGAHAERGTALETHDVISTRRLAHLWLGVAAVEIWLFAGWAIADWLLSLTGKTPQWLDSIIRLGFGVRYRDAIVESEDMQICAVTLIILISLSALGILEAWLIRVVWKQFDERWMR